MEQHEHIKQESDDQDNMDLSESEGMNEDQQALFLNIQRSKSNDSFLGKLLPQIGDAPDRSLVWEPPQLTNNIVVPQTRSVTSRDRDAPAQQPQNSSLKGIFKIKKREKVKSRCDYDKNICGYITKKVIREFVSKSYENQVMQLVNKYNKCTYNQCKAYYLRKVQMVTGPSHMPQLFQLTSRQAESREAESINCCKKVFKRFYRWFLKERYLRYLLIEGKMANKKAYIEYKNNNLFKYATRQDLLQEQSEQVEPPVARTRSRGNVKLQQMQK